MIDYQIISEPDKKYRKEYTYAYVWLRPRAVIDARYLRLDSSRNSVMYNVAVLSYRLMAINSNVGKALNPNDISRYIGSKVAKAVKDYNKRSPVYQNDIEDIVDRCFKVMPSKNMNIVTKQRLQWKPNIGELLTLSEKEQKHLLKLKGDDADDYISKIRARKKMDYANEVISDAIKVDIIVRIESAIEAIKSVPHNALLTRREISNQSGIPYSTVCKYINEIPELAGGDVANEKTEAAIRVCNLLEDACYNIHQENKRITKLGLHKETKVSRTTIYKKWEDGDFNLKALVGKLNSKLNQENKKSRSRKT